jgi:DNA-binding NarL/FixJ family response regulator
MDGCDRVRDFERASQWCTRIRDAAERWKLPAVITACRPHYAVVLAWRGEWAAAEAELTAAIAESNATRPPMAVEGIARLAELRLRQGRISDARELFAQVEHEGLAQLGRAELALAEGDAETAADLAARYVRRLPSDDGVERAPGLELLARACLATAELERAAEAAAELRAIANAIGTAALQAAAHFANGIVAAAYGERQDARIALEDAVDLYAREGAPFETARARVELGRLLAESGAMEPAGREWRAALIAFDAIGATRQAAATADLLSRTAEVADVRALPLGLSKREVEVLRLIAAGDSNREIAAELVLSVRTVERHVSNIYAKLGATGTSARAAVTAHAFRAGLISTAL